MKSERSAMGSAEYFTGKAIAIAVAIAVVAVVAVTDAKPRQTPVQPSPAEKLLQEARAVSLKGDIDGAYQRLDAALRADPSFWQAIYYRAELHFQQHQYESTLQDCAEILRMKPDAVVAALLHAQANTKLGRNDECLRELDQVVSRGNKKDVAPLIIAYEMRAWLRATSPDGNYRDGKRALIDAKQACKLSNDHDAQSLDTLAAAYAEVGDFNSALDAEDRAIRAQLISDQFNMATQDVFQKHLASFKQHRPIRDE
jgi:tetratricopeptide (TPR) repeat protein